MFFCVFLEILCVLRGFVFEKVLCFFVCFWRFCVFEEVLCVFIFVFGGFVCLKRFVFV